ncbi:hypothetical protein NDA10_007440 [Ustilago hordei]|uniref:Uncharacterized protein n=1 Tax=Ustilago hordei TaxID=120017 RepID=I2FQN3_USTHO|nr:uncharacterized protein UHO2_05202 [Ustilago hordei]KAJ1042923.1 hypothetical protein NDA10_007440 [Ustilago hordei]CCF49226.1 uncharacterized protein UHOR_07617 [Ustilago hordei]SYW80022.1 uncharacterized protein UHO2_05202 [Ustilago hordei]
MSPLYDRQMSASSISFDNSADRSYSRSPSRTGNSSTDLSSGSSRGHHSNASSASFGGKGGAPMHAIMLPGVVAPSVDRPHPDSPFSQWEAYIVNQAQQWSDKRAKVVASPPPTNNSRIVWADQICKSAPQSHPFTYTKARDRVASLPPQRPPPPNPCGGLLLDLLRSSVDIAKSSDAPPASERPSISSPILPKSILSTVPASPAFQGHVYAPTAVPAAGFHQSFHNRSVTNPAQVPRNVESHASSIRCLSPLPLSLPGDDSSPSLLNNLDERASSATTFSGRAPGPSELLDRPLPALYRAGNASTPSIADTYSHHSHRSSWASSVDLDPAIICTPPLSHDGWQEQPQASRPPFLDEYDLDQDTDESENEDSAYSHETNLSPHQAIQDQQHQHQQLSPEPVFQRLEAGLLSHAGHADDMHSKPRLGPDGSPLPCLEISSLPREKESEIRNARARLISPVSFKKALSIKSKGSASGSDSGSRGPGSPSIDSTPSLPNSSSEEIGKISEPTTPAAAVSRMPPQLPTLVTQDMESWAAAIPAEARPISPVKFLASPIPEAPLMQMSPSIESEAYLPTLDSTHSSSSAQPLSLAFSNSPGTLTSRSSIDGRSSLNSNTNDSSLTGRRKHRVATPGLTKLSASQTVAAAPTLDPHLARGNNTHAQSSGSASSHNPSLTLSNTSSAGRRVSRRIDRSRITNSMPSFADMASSLIVPVSNQRRFSNRSLSSEGSIDNHSNASNGSSYAKVGGSSDEGVPPMSPSLPAPKGVLKKRSPSEVSSLLSPKKEVSFDLPASSSFGVVAEDSEEEQVQVLEHEQRQRRHLKLPPMKLQAAPANRDSVSKEETASAEAIQSCTLSQDDLDVLTFLSSFGRELKTIESLEVLDTVQAGTNEWPKRGDWHSLSAYLMAYAITFLSVYSDDSATLVYSAERAPRKAWSEAKKTVSAPILSSNALYTSLVRSVVRIASWEQPLVSAGVSSAYAYSWAKGRLAAMTFVGLALLVATQGAQSSSSTAASESEELSEAYNRIANVLLGSSETHKRMRNLLLWRFPRASLRFTGLLLTAALIATRVDSSFMLQLPGLFFGLVLFVWLPIVLHQPNWVPASLSTVNPIDMLLYDVPTDAQHAILTLRRRAASGEQLIHLPTPPTRTSLPSLSPTAFDHRMSAQELIHVSDILESSHFAFFHNQAGHFIVLASRVIFRTLAGKIAPDEPISLLDELVRTQDGGSPGCKITLDARLDKLVRVEKTEVGGLKMKLKNGQVFDVEKVERRDGAFNLLMALAPQKWY